MICCILGHREICETEELKRQLTLTIEDLIAKENVDTFLFGSKSSFNSLCYELITQVKVKYPHIKRIYVRAEFPVINEDYREFLLKRYEDTYYPEGLTGAGRLVYIKRNEEMIGKSQFCLFYFDAAYAAKGRSGTKIAYDYALKHKKRVIQFPLLHTAPQSDING